MKARANSQYNKSLMPTAYAWHAIRKPATTITTLQIERQIPRHATAA